MEGDCSVLLAYVGGGKGKTTAGLGVALRTWGHGYRVLVAFLMKTPLYMGEEVGEYKALRRLGIDVVTIEEFGNPQAMWESVLEVLDTYDLVLLDEFNYAVRQGFIAPGDVFRLRGVKPHVVVTGNHLWPELAEAADLISEIRAIKHYYPKATGIRGLDW
jgi:cob(I)yrinic acid a,c-diamide adenosyltransferase (EC 2.5.1.17)